MKLLMRFLACFSILFITSCAFTVHDLPLNYSYDNPVTLGFSPECDKTISVKDIEDNREIENPRMIMHMRNLNGDITTGGWQAEKPLTEIVKDALVDALKASGLNYSEKQGNLSLSGEIMDIENRVISGFFTGTLELEIMVKFTLKDEDNEEVIWRDTFVGRSSSKASSYTTAIEEGFPAALDDLIEELFSDEMFLNKLRKNLTKENEIQEEIEMSETDS